MKSTRVIAAVASLAVLAVACGDSDDQGSSPIASTAVPATTPSTSVGTPTTVQRPTDGTVVSGIDDAQDATIQIVAKGALRDPEVGYSTKVGSGSGFIIDADGLAVTNNHVVTGAATLEVFIGGDTTKSYNATVVGVSECNDLALIDINAPGDLPRFEWYDSEVSTGLDVYAAGFPLGDPQFTLTRGIVAKAKAGGDLTGTSSIDHTIEHDANIQPGNSGGPLLTADGKVAGVNYAGGAVASSTEQFFAIASPLAQNVVDHLAQGDFESLGINGWAVFDDAAGISGIWVAGVAPGSPASKTGVLPGDIVTTMNGLPVGTDGTFKDYCDVMRTSADRPIDVEVLRYDSLEVLRGEINGEKELEQAFSFADQIDDDATADSTGSYEDYVAVTDQTGVMTVEVPAEWSDVDVTPADDGRGSSVPYIAAAPELDAFLSTWGTPGMQFAALPSAAWTIDDVLATYGASAQCTDGGIESYDDGAFAGSYQLWTDCNGTDTVYVVLATTPANGSPYVFATIVQAVTDADLEALDHIFGTFNIVA
ncbi:MAG: S1C family serine protease [Acidimicrobiia bacterium]